MIDRNINSLLTKLQGYVDLKNSDKKKIKANLQPIDDIYYQNFVFVDLMKLKKLGNDLKTREYLLNITEPDFEIKANNFRKRELSFWNYQVNKIKENSIDWALSGTLLASSSLGPMTGGITAVAGGIAIGTGVLAVKLITNNYGVNNIDMKYLINKMNSDSPSDIASFEKLISVSKSIPDNIRNGSFNEKKEYVQQISNVYKNSDRYLKRLLQDASFNDVVTIMEKSREVAKRHGLSFDFKELTSQNKTDIFVQKQLKKITNYYFLKTIKDNESIRNKVILGVAKMDKKETDMFVEHINKSFSGLGKHFKNITAAVEMHQKFSDSILLIAKNNNIDFNAKNIEGVEKIMGSIIDYKETIVDFSYDNLKENTFLKDLFKNDTLFEIKNLDGLNKAMAQALPEAYRDDFLKNIDDLSSFKKSKLTKALIEKTVDAFEEQKYLTQSLSEKLKQDNWQSNRYGKLAIDVLEGVQDLQEDAINLYRKNTDPNTQIMISYGLDYSRKALKILGQMGTFLGKTYGEKVPDAIANASNRLRDVDNEIKTFDRSIHRSLINKNASKSTYSMIAKLIKDNKGYDEQKSVSDIKVLKNKHSTP